MNFSTQGDKSCPLAFTQGSVLGLSPDTSPPLPAMASHSCPSATAQAPPASSRAPAWLLLPLSPCHFPGSDLSLSPESISAGQHVVFSPENSSVPELCCYLTLRSSDQVCQTGHKFPRGDHFSVQAAGACSPEVWWGSGPRQSPAPPPR